MNKSLTPATDELNRLLKLPDSSGPPSLGNERGRVTQRGTLGKPSSSHALDMCSLQEASDQIKGYQSFPTIEWPLMMAEYKKYDTDDLLPLFTNKRRCHHGLPNSSLIRQILELDMKKKNKA